MEKLRTLLLICLTLALMAVAALAQHTETTAPHNGFRNIYTYDANNNKISDVEQEFVNNTWQDIGINKVVYDKNNNPISSVSQYGWQCFFGYDSHNNRTFYMRQYKKNGVYENVERYYYTFDSSNKETGEIMQQAKGATDWVNFSQTYFKKDTTMRQDWDGAKWVNTSRQFTTYDTRGNKTCVLAQNWKDGAWVNHERWTITYDANNKEIDYKDEIWDGIKWGPWQPMRDGYPIDTK